MEIAIEAARGELDEPRGENPLDALDRDAYVTAENLEGFECEWEG
jgi:hypothetical protein